MPEFRELFIGRRGQKELTLEGKLVFQDGVRWGKFTIQRGKGIISKMDDNTDADIVLENSLIFPGFVDIHVHAREDPSGKWNYKEDYKTAGQAAVAGGITAFADMPNTPHPLISDKSLMKKAPLTRKAGTPVLLYAAVGPGTRPLNENVPYKLFMGKSVGPLFFKERKELRKTLSSYHNMHVSFHCEDPDILKENEHKPEHSERRPPEAEINAVELALELIEEFELQGKLCHISTKEGMELIERAKRSGVKVEMEVTPHHLLFEDNGNGVEFPKCLTQGDEPLPQRFFQVNPPIRNGRDRRALLSAFANGKIDYLATDHAPHTPQEKQEGKSGLTHLDTYGNVVGCLLEMGIRPEVIVSASSLKPAEFMGKFMPLKRGVEKGNVANITVLTREKTTVRRESLFTKAGWSPFQGCTFPWSVKFTMIRGRAWATRVNEK